MFILATKGSHQYLHIKAKIWYLLNVFFFCIFGVVWLGEGPFGPIGPLRKHGLWDEGDPFE